MPHRTENDPHKFRRRGVLFVLSSPSGAGKSTIARKLLAADPFLEMSVSYTTRPMHPDLDAATQDRTIAPVASFKA